VVWRKPPCAARCLVGAFLCAFALSGCASTSTKKPTDEAAAAALAQSQSSKVTPAMLALPEAAYDEGHYQDALGLYRQLLVRDPTNDQIKLGIADCELASNNPSDANQLYQELENDSSIHAQVLQGRGIALLRLGQIGPAEQTLKSAVTANPKLWRAWNALGALYDAGQQWNEADQAYAKALALEPGSAAINNNLGFSLLSQGQLQQAVQSLQAALAIEPSLQPAKMNLRIALALEGRYDDATAGVDGPDLPATLNNVGFAAMARGDYTKAEAYFTQAIDASSTYEVAASKNLLELKVITGKGTSTPGGT
jgi:Flp pilus assembly protein TadD